MTAGLGSALIRIPKGDVLARGVALFFGAFSILNSVGGLYATGFDTNLWWIDLRWMPQAIAGLLLLLSSACLIGFAIRPPRSLWRRWMTMGCVGVLALACLANTVQFYILLAHRTLSTVIPVPLSLLLAGTFIFILVVSARGPLPERGFIQNLGAVAVCCACVFVFPIAQMLFFGKTDYRRPADAVVVLGARVYADGRPSDALADRVRTASQLYRAGYAKKLIVSGGPGDGAIRETESMKRMAVRLGVPAEDILEDTAGLNTQATVKNTDRILNRLHAARVLVVSHFYHLPRIKLAYKRDGREVYTVPARESYLLRQLPYNILREVAAVWAYYLRPLVGR